MPPAGTNVRPKHSARSEKAARWAVGASEVTMTHLPQRPRHRVAVWTGIGSHWSEETTAEIGKGSGIRLESRPSPAEWQFPAPMKRYRRFQVRRRIYAVRASIG